MILMGRNPGIFGAAGAAAGATWAQLFTAMGSPPGVAYAFGDSTQISASRTGGSWGVASTDPIGYVLDQARGGLGALGADLVTNGDFASDTAWTKGAGWTISGGVASRTNTGSGSDTRQTISTTSGRSYVITFTATITSGDFLVQFDTTGANLRNVSGTYSEIITASASSVALKLVAGVSFSGSIDNITVRELPGLHAAATSDARRPVYGAFDGGAAMAAQFNGSAHCLQSVAALDMTSTDEVHVFAAVRALTNGADRMVAEFGVNASTTNGSFSVFRSPSNGYIYVSRGTTARALLSATTFPQPDSALLRLSSKISGPLLTGSRNAVGVVSTAVTQGSGNYANQLLNIGARNVASPSLFFNGQIANLAIIGGPMTTEQVDTAVALASAGLTFSP